MKKRGKVIFKIRKHQIWEITKKILGVLLILLGLTGLALPILPGWIFLILGLGLISDKYLKILIKETKDKWKKFRQRFKNQRK